MERKQTIAWTCLFCALVACPVLGQQREVSISQVGDVISKWQPDQHLYVKGDLGIGKQQLASLESWLDENGPHWTIVLMRNANNESYQAIDGRQFRGMDAVEYALGHGLANRTAFGELENPKTGETDGAVFVLFLDERKFSYYGSDAQDRRRVGESHWIGELDRPAKRAMRSGGRILDAVKNTVTSINSRVDRAIVAEEAARERAEQQRLRAQRERERVIAELRVEIDDAQRDLIAAVETAAARLKEKYPEAQGELAQPPLAAWRSQLASAANTLSEENVRATSQQVDNVVAEINGYLDAYAEHQSLDDLIAPLAARIAQRGTGPRDVARMSNNSATELIEQARAVHARGERGFSQSLTDASAALDQGDAAIAAENERLRRAALRRRIIRNTVLVSAALLALAIFALLCILNRRRRPARQRAHEAFEARQQLVNAAMEGVFELFERSGEILGSEQKAAQRGYTGTTKELTKRTFDDVDDLLVLSNEVERVMDEARDLIYPTKLLARMANMFTGSRYERGVNRITGEPLVFTRDKGLPLVIARESQAHAPSVGGGEEPESISMTFEEVFAAFHERRQDASTTLDTIENSLLDVNDRLAELQARINHATDVERQLAEAADDDGYFPLPAFFEQLLPSAQQDYDDADALCSTDPVQAIQQQIRRGWRKLNEALSIADAIKQGRGQMFPKLEKSAPQLEQLGYDVKWLEENVQALGVRADELMAAATKHSIAEDAEEFALGVTSLGERAVYSVELANHLKDKLVPSIDRFRNNVVSARRDVAKALGISEAESLHEHQHDPDTHLTAAGKQLEAARAALHHGGVKTAREAIEVLQREVSQGQLLVDDTLEALREFERSLLEREQEYEAVEDKLPRYKALLADVRHEYAASALVLRAGDPSFPDPTATADGHLANCQELLSDVHRWIGDAVTIHRQGKVLQAAAQLATVESAVEQANQLLDDIQSHCKLLEAKSRENQAAAARMVTHAEGLRDQIRDRRTSQPTITDFEQVVQSLRQSQHDVEVATDRDPFQNALRLTALAERLEEVDALIVADRNAHAEAARAVDGAKAQLSTAQRIVHQSRTDQIPDSAKVIDYQGEIASLASNLDAVERRLNVPHEDWRQVDEEAARINAELGVAAGRLRDELQLAEQSVNALRRASEEVFRATRWTGGYGIRITGTPGADELERARRALSSGDYAFMMQMSRAAMQASQQAIQAAEREVLRRRRAADRAAEAARRRRRRQQSIFQGSSGFGGLSSSGGSRSFGSSSTSSSSSSSSSSSGFSRSGW